MGRKDYNKGMEAGARPFEEKFRQEQKRNQEWKQTFEEKFDHIKETNEAILDEMEDREKEKFYKLHTIVDIKKLEKGDREILLSLLFTLAGTQEEMTELQQLFLRSVKKYLENEKEDKRPTGWSALKAGDWSVVEGIYGIDETKAIAQAVMEFLFLGYKSHEAYMEDYEDLFECFNLNKRGFGEIREQIDMICRGTGLQGLAEMYGYVPEDDTPKEADGGSDDEKEDVSGTYGTHGKLEELRTDEAVRIASGEVRIFENKKLIFANRIKVENSQLLFKNCNISIDMETSEAKNPNGHFIDMSKGTVSFEDCVIGDWNNLFISAFYAAKLIIKNCRIFKVEKFWDGNRGNVEIWHSCIEPKPCGILDEDRPFDSKSLFYGANITISNTTIKGNVKFDAAELLRINECRFHGITDLSIPINTEVYRSNFENCCVMVKFNSGGKYEYKEKGGVFQSCEFKACTFKTRRHENNLMCFENSKLLFCVGTLPTRYMKDVMAGGGFLCIDTDKEVQMERCHFTDFSYKKYISGSDDENIYDLFPFYSFTPDEEKAVITVGRGSMEGCTFKNMDLGNCYLIGGNLLDYSSFKIMDCCFENIQTGIGGILRKSFNRQKGGLLGTKTVTENADMKIEGCTGL